MLIKGGIVGGTGYTGVELLRLLSQRDDVELCCVTSRELDGQTICSRFPSLRGQVDLSFSNPDSSDLKDCEIVFFATPHFSFYLLLYHPKFLQNRLSFA